MDGDVLLVHRFGDGLPLSCGSQCQTLELGGTDEGAPGPRSEDFYAAYVRDLDGNKLAVFVA